MKNKQFMAIAPLFLIVAIDSMGLGIIFPLLSSMIMDPNSTFLAAETTSFHRDILYGLIIGIYMLAWFFGAAVLGDISDIVGRRKSLLVCLGGSFIGYVLSGMSFFCHSITLLIVGRVIAGFTAGSQPIAQAAIVDISAPEHKARNIGMILLATSVGFILGPLAGGIFSNSSFVSWFDFSTPMYFAALLSLVNALFLWFVFQETFTQTRKVKIRPHLAIEIFVASLKHPKVYMLSVVLLIFISGWSEYFSFVSQFLLKVYNYTPLQTSLFITVLAAGFGIGTGILLEPLAKNFSMKRCIIIASVISAVIALITAITDVEWIVWACSLGIGTSVAVAYALLITLFSNQVDNTEQGWVMGVTNAIMALSFGVTTFFSGFAIHYNAAMPLYLAFGGMLIAAVVLKFSKV